VRIIVADDHGLVRDSLRQYLEQLDTSVEIDDAASLHDVRTHADEKPDLVLLDLQMPGMNGPRSIADVRQMFPDSRIVVVSGLTDPVVIRSVIQYGANGYIPKTARGKSLVTALKLVLDGETYLPSALLEEANSLTASLPPGATPGFQENGFASFGNGSTDAGKPLAGGFEKLSVRESAALRLLISGKSNKEIARELDLQEVTVKVHLRNVYRKIKATSRTDAVRIALQQGWH
jgi:DNA-binding NarL/FixJ family response regulator